MMLKSPVVRSITPSAMLCAFSAETANWWLVGVAQVCPKYVTAPVRRSSSTSTRSAPSTLGASSRRHWRTASFSPWAWRVNWRLNARCAKYVRKRRLDPPPPELLDWHVEPLLEPERLDVELERAILVGYGYSDGVHAGNPIACLSFIVWPPSWVVVVSEALSVQPADPPPCEYCSDPGVSSSSPVSRSVLSPERIIGQPP